MIADKPREITMYMEWVKAISIYKGLCIYMCVCVRTYEICIRKRNISIITKQSLDIYIAKIIQIRSDVQISKC